MKSFLFAAAAVAALAQPAFAAPQLSGIVADVLAGDWPQSTQIGFELFGPINIDTASYGIAEARLDSVRDAFGGTIQSVIGPNGAELSWLCYDYGGLRTWFVSTGEIDKGGGILIGLIAEETLVPTAPDARCKASDGTLVPMPGGDDTPGVGASLADLAKRFGGAVTPDADGKLSFFNQTVLDDARGPAIQNVFYVVRDGIVVSVAFSEVRGDA